MKIYMGSDHRGFELKQKLVLWLQENGHEIVDCGNDHLDPEDDYVDFTFCVAEKVAAELEKDPKAEVYGIGICGSGVGVSIAANRVHGIRCSLSHKPEHAKHAKENDHVNMLALPAEWVSLEDAQQIINTFLNTEILPKDKYFRRAKKLDI